MKLAALACCFALAVSAATPVPVIFDTDMGNDVDDAIALAMLHALESRGECRIDAVTVTKDNPWAAVYVDLIDNFYGCGRIPVGVVKGSGITPQGSRMIEVPSQRKDAAGQFIYPRHLASGTEAPDATSLLERVLASEADGSVVIVQVGFSTNLAHLLSAGPQAMDLVRRKVKLLVMMAGNFVEPQPEFNVAQDIPSARKVLRDWPGPIVLSGFEIGRSMLFPATVIEHDLSYVQNHPIADAYRNYAAMPYDRPTWDPTAALYAIRPDAGYFTLSPPGEVTVDDKGRTSFEPSASGRRRYLTMDDRQRTRALEAIELLATQPPDRPNASDIFGWQIGPFVRPVSEPVITPNRDSVFRNPVDGTTVHWEALHTFNPAAIVRNGKIYVLYRAEDDTGEMRIGLHTSRLGLAESDDGIHFHRLPLPVLYPDNDSEKAREWPGGCEDPRIVEAEDGTYVLTYTQWNRRRTDAAIATSKDLIHWTKHGPALGAAGKYASLSYKSAGIVTRMERGRLIAAKIHGRYWMYWGEGEIRLATSTDLIHWRPVEDSSGQPVVVLAKRSGRFDSSFPETGPPPVLTEHGILVLYNGKNAAEGGDPALAANSYAAGEALFAADDPTKLLARTDRPVLQPQMEFERIGQYAAGTTFAEGLVWFQDKWFLYYGCADSLVGVAVAEKPPH